ncbi:hypothetical protein LTR78_008023 [Recurvomyces mirabilis]|uniref:Uncharacterized protein n=1 Tax=Recurvomyces mirabilis TaxID=574656 RepID=A0AAE0TV09_9PEZI|nr:hypothetical protein LTR78_008023 [Recurvomyces mirabilis]KAK5150751.1 hypothetical protein LTS14_009814 [Recurvomyces mirabilis]
MPPPQGSLNPIEGPGDYTFTKEVHDDTYAAIDPTKADHTGHSVFIVGASRGIGAAIASSFAKAGASAIAIGARSDLSSHVEAIKLAAKRAGRAEPKVLSVRLDITDIASVEEAAKTVSQAFGGTLDILIHNSGIIGAMIPITLSDPADWWRTYEVNVRGPYLIARSFIPLLLKSTLKTFITVSSVGCTVSNPGVSAYQSGKTALTRVTEFAALENQEEGLVAFSVHPGNINTGIVDLSSVPDAFKAVFTETVELPADGLVYLTNEKRDWLSGRYVNMTWDLPELTSSPKKDEIVEKDLLKIRLMV